MKLRLSRNGHALLTFSVPALDRGSYAPAAWCPGCAAYSRGRTFFVQDTRGFAEPFPSQGALRITSTEGCPVTIPNGRHPPGDRGRHWHGNGLLWAGLPRDGVRAIGPQLVNTDGSLSDKLLWSTTPGDRAPLVTGRRLDAAAPPLRVPAAHFAASTAATRPSWMTPVVFPSAVCWRITARIRDVSLTYVTKVVRQR